jgi:hypothetical protein
MTRSMPPLRKWAAMAASRNPRAWRVESRKVVIPLAETVDRQSAEIKTAI